MLLLIKRIPCENNCMRKSRVLKQSDSAGDYEVEIFEVDNPKHVVVCSHGNGVRRWDGEHFFHNVASHYPDIAFYLVDQNQVIENGCQLNPLPILVQRVEKALNMARKDYNASKIVVMGHSMGCGVVSQMDQDGVDEVIFVAPAAGTPDKRYIDRWGADIAEGKMVQTKDGLNKLITKEFMDSIKDITWEKEYPKMLKKFSNVHVFESGDEEIVGEERFTHRSMPFASYEIIPGAKHDLNGSSLELLYKKLDKLLP